VFSLVATLVGGGCLSLPFAFQKTGLVLGVTYLFVSGVLSGYSMRLLLSCSRRTGAQNYEECGEKAFGPRMKYVTMCLLIGMTFLASVAYLILARDLATPLVESYVTGHQTEQKTHNLIALVCLLPVVPLCYAKSLHSLRFTSLVSLLALCLLSVAIVYRTVDRASQRPIRIDELKLASAKVSDTVYALPFMELSFMAHFNLLPVHIGLRKPTRRRLDQVVFYTIFSAFVFYLLISFSGYLFAYDHVCGDKSPSTCKDGVPDNILNAFDLHDTLIDIGRFGFLMAILLSFPLLVLPCRDTVLRLYHELSDEPSAQMQAHGDSAGDSYVRLSDEWANEEEFMASADAVEVIDSTGREALSRGNGAHGGGGALANDNHVPVTPGDNLTIIDSPDSPEFRTPHLRLQERRMARRMLEHIDLCSREGIEHVGVTTLINILVVLCMYFIPGVAVVWNITGSTVAMLLSFVFPAAFYVRIRSPDGFWHPHQKDQRFVSAWLLLVFSLITTVVCTVESVGSVLK